ncbi:unnamed protein product [Orchesella dallaii]|uniref:Peptidase S1 domain-containing protein n=1 Tax=Orchesella dallaii TaxID=48710 RepID=A0ABP1RUU1_9HEXA
MTSLHLTVLVLFLASSADCSPYRGHALQSVRFRNQYRPTYQFPHDELANYYENGLPEDIVDEALNSVSERLTLEDQLSGRVRGGRNAREGELPYQLRIVVSTPATVDGKRYCGGILSHLYGYQFAITAAHCLWNSTSTFIVAGDRKISGLAYEQYRDVTTWRIHEQFVGDDVSCADHDVALMFYATPFNLDYYVSPITLAKRRFLPKTVLISGWGNTISRYIGTKTSDILQVANITTTDDNYCQRFSRSLCTLTKSFCTVQRGLGDCRGDSGGAAVAKDPTDGKWYAIGIFTNILGDCGDDFHPTAFARVSDYKKWMKFKVVEHFNG